MNCYGLLQAIRMLPRAQWSQYLERVAFQNYLNQQGFADSMPKHGQAWKEELKTFVERIKTDDGAQQWEVGQFMEGSGAILRELISLLRR